MPDDGVGFWLTDHTHPNYEAAKYASAVVYGSLPDLTREGGFSVPALILQVPSPTPSLIPY